MTRSWRCDGPDCDEVMDEAGIEVTYLVDADFGIELDDDDDEPIDDWQMAEAHFCSFECLTAWSFTMAEVKASDASPPPAPDA